jgi:hypothetical protein
MNVSVRGFFKSYECNALINTDYILIFLLNETDVQFAVSADLFPRGKWFAMSKLSAKGSR